MPLRLSGKILDLSNSSGVMVGLPSRSAISCTVIWQSFLSYRLKYSYHWSLIVARIGPTIRKTVSEAGNGKTWPQAQGRVRRQVSGLINQDIGGSPGRLGGRGQAPSSHDPLARD